MIKVMNFAPLATRFQTTPTSRTFSARHRFVRLIVFTVLLPFFLNLGLSSCSQPDTVAPVSAELHSSARQQAGLLGFDGFEDAKIAKFWRTELRTPTAGLMVSEQRRSGKQAMRFSWKPSQANGTNDMLHSELAMEALPVGETERWYGYSSYMPSASMANDNKTVIVSQWHGHPDPGFFDSVPPVAISVEPGNKLELVYRASNKPMVKPLQHPTSQIVKDLGPALFDRWVDYVVHVKWDPTGTTGILQVWQNGVLKVNEQNIQIGYLQQRKPFWKAGLYCWTGQSKHSEKVIYYDEVRIGDATATYDSVKPGLNDGTAKARP